MAEQVFGVTEQGFVLKRLHDILAGIVGNLQAIVDPVSGETLTPNLADENDPLVQLANSVADELSVCWEQLEQCYNQFDPLKATGVGLSGTVQLNGILKRLDEKDAQLRSRQQKSTSLTSFRHVDSIYAAVINVPDVTYARVCQNSKIETDDRGIPGKSISVVVIGGDDQAIADAIFGKVGVGMDYFGDVQVDCLDSLGTSYPVAFQRPIVVPIDIVVELTAFAQWPANGEALVKAALTNYSKFDETAETGLAPGVPVINSALYSPVNTVPGAQIVAIKLARGGAEPEVQNVPINWNEVALVTEDNIRIVIL